MKGSSFTMARDESVEEERMDNDFLTKDESRAVTRYQVISSYLALEPKRGERAQLLGQLAARTWHDHLGEPFQVSPETIRSWVRRYRQRGLVGLADKQRPRRGSKALTPEQIEIACKLKEEVPARSLDRILIILEDMGFVEKGMVRRSTLHRALKARGLSARRCRVPDANDLDRFEADFPNDMWQSDMLVGPWLPDPERPGKKRRAYLYAFLDDHSRLLLHGRFSFKGDLPALELVFRRALQKYGRPRRVYYDNGQVYRSHHMKQIAAAIGVHRIIFTKAHRPMGHGKVESFNRTVRSAFLAELKASSIRTLDELNEAFLAFIDLEYNRKVHSETGQVPLERWRTVLDKVQYVDEEQIRQSFLWREDRTPDKSGVFSLFRSKYQVQPELARRRIQVRYNPESLERVEIWHNEKFVERVTPFQVQGNRRPKPASSAPDEADKRSREHQPELRDHKQEKPTADYLAHLVRKRRKEFLQQGGDGSDGFAASSRATPPSADHPWNKEVIGLLEESLDADAFDEEVVKSYLDRFGPFEPDLAHRVLENLLGATQKDMHVSFYLDAIRQANHRKDT